MNKLLRYFLPHEKNDHRPRATRHPGIITILIMLLTVQTSMNVFFSTNPMILGFATSIYQDELISQTNSERAQASLSTLIHNPKLDQAAQLKALDMFEADYWAHVSPTGVEPWHWFSVVGYDYQTAGENLARDFDTSAGVVSAWMASPSHRENILFPSFTEIGIAVVNGNLNGEDTTLVVQMFGTPTPTQQLAVVVQPTQPQPTPTTVIPTAIPTANISAPTPTPFVSVNTPTPIVHITPEATITTEPTTTPEPTPTNIPELAVNRTNTNGTVLGPLSGHTSNPPTSTLLSANIAALTNIESFGLSRLFTMLIVGTLIGLYASDDFIARRKGLKRINAHRIVHVGILIIAFLGIWYGAGGMIL